MNKKVLVNLIIIMTIVLWTQNGLSDGMLISVRPDAPAFAVKYHHVDVKIDQQVANTKINQVFRNEANQELEGTYLFPLPNEAVISDFTMYVGMKRSKEEYWRRMKPAKSTRTLSEGGKTRHCWNTSGAIPSTRGSILSLLAGRSVWS